MIKLHASGGPKENVQRVLRLFVQNKMSGECGELHRTAFGSCKHLHEIDASAGMLLHGCHVRILSLKIPEDKALMNLTSVNLHESVSVASRTRWVA